MVPQNIVFLNISKSKETSVGHSRSNRAHVVIALDLTYDLVIGRSTLPADIVILGGYDAQKMETLNTTNPAKVKPWPVASSWG